MSSTPNNAIPYVPENTIDPAAGLNLSLQAIDALLQLSVISVGDTTPPAAPAEGGSYIVGPGASGDWANQSGKLATWTGGVWEFRTAWYAVTGGELWVFDGLGWTNTTSDVGTAAARDAIGAGDVYARGGILGTVSQSGGVPTGAIIERGSNSDGEYVKFADGTQICNKVISGLGPINSQEGGAYRLYVGVGTSGVWAKPFSSKPFICSATENTATGSYSWLAYSGGVSAIQVGVFNLFRATAELGVDYSIRVTAIGRWF